MKKIKLLFFSILLLTPLLDVFASGSITLSSNNLSISEGKSATFTIKANSAAGRVDISSSDNKVASVSIDKEFLDNSTLTVTVTGKKAGKAVISVNLKDVATYDGDELKGTKTLNVAVVSESTDQTPGTPNVQETKHLNITKLEVVGYDINFDINKSEYTINVDSNVNKIFILAECEECNITGNDEVNIEGKSQVFVTFKNNEEERMYTININREENVVTPSEQDSDVIVTPEPTNKSNSSTLTYILIGCGVVLVLLIIIVLSKKKKKTTEEVSTNVTINNQPNPIQTQNNYVPPTINQNVTPQVQNQTYIQNGIYTNNQNGNM